MLWLGEWLLFDRRVEWEGDTTRVKSKRGWELMGIIQKVEFEGSQGALTLSWSFMNQLSLWGKTREMDCII